MFAEVNNEMIAHSSERNNALHAPNTLHVTDFSCASGRGQTTREVHFYIGVSLLSAGCALGREMIRSPVSSLREHLQETTAVLWS